MNLNKFQLILGFFLLSPLLLFAQDSSEFCAKQIISKIDFIGLEITKDHVVKRELTNREGQVLNCESLENEKNKLLGLDIFSSINTSSRLEGDSLILTYIFKELPAYLIIPAIAKTDQEGWLASINLATLNLGGIDIRSQASWRTNFHPKLNTSNEYFAHIGSPWLGELPLEYLFFIGKTQSFNTLKEFDEESYRNEVGLYYRVHPKLSLLMEHAGYYTQHTSDSLKWHDQGDVDVILGYGLGLRFDNLNNTLNPTKGFYSELEWMPHFLGSESLAYQLFKGDFRTWQSIGHHIAHVSSLLRYRLGKTAFYEAYHLGGVNSLRGYDPDPDRHYQSEWLNTIEYRYQIVELSPFTLPVLDWNLFWGLESVVGWDLVYNWDPNKKGDFYHAPFIGLHLLQPGIQRIRFELGLKGFKSEVSFAIGFYEKSTTQNWIGR